MKVPVKMVFRAVDKTHAEPVRIEYKDIPCEESLGLMFVDLARKYGVNIYEEKVY